MNRLSHVFRLVFSLLAFVLILSPSAGAEEEAKDCPKPSKTLFEWAVDGHCGFCKKCKPANGEKENGEEEEEEDRIATDRPDSTETSNTVGLGRIQIEGGFTYTRDNDDGTRTRSYSYPETLIRVGMFAEWFEFRLGWNYARENSRRGGSTSIHEGAEDLYLGVKLALTEQKECLPEMALILQTTVPTGADFFSANETLPGFNLLYSWEVNDCIAVGGGSALNRAVDDSDHSYLEYFQTATVGYSLTDKLGAFTEWFAVIPHSAEEAKTEHYINGGFTYLIHSNFQIDWRIGFGLNEHADDFFTGAGFGVRY